MDEDEQEAQAQLEALEAITPLIESITNDPYQYDKHVEYIEKLKVAGMDEEVSAARKQMYTYFPLTEELWNQWIDDEISKDDKDGRIAAIKVFDLAVDDFFSVSLWKRYTDFVLENHKAHEDEFSRAFVERIMDKAISSVGYHVTESGQIWNAYRDFEMEELEASADSIQVETIKTLYLRRLEVPHTGIEETFSAYSSFITTYANDSYEESMLAANSIYSSSQSRTYECERLEAQLAEQSNSLDAFQGYIKNELSRKKPSVAFVRTLYERGLSVHYFVPSLWEDYIAYMLKVVSVQLVFDVAKRAVRNCPWSGDIVACHMRLLERGRLSDDIRKAYTTALEMPTLTAQVDEVIKVILAYVDYVRRTIDWEAEPDETQLASLRQALTEGFGIVKNLAVDPYYRLERYLISIETYQVQDYDRARKVWEKLTKAHHDNSEMWTQYAAWERHVGISTGDINRARAVYKAASGKRTDWPERIFEAWLQFEHECGTLDQIEYATARIRKETASLTARRAREAQQAAEATAQEQPSAVEPMAIDTPNDRKRKAEDEQTTQQQSKKAKNGEAERDREHTTVHVGNLPDTSQANLKSFFKDCGEIREIKMLEHEDKVSAIVEFTEKEGALAAATRDKKKIGDNQVSVILGSGTTLYVTNYPESLGSEKAMRDIFEKHGTILEIRFPSKVIIKSRRFCYIQFASAEEAQRGLDNDGMYMDGLRMSVMISNPSKKKKRTDADAPKKSTASARSFVPLALKPRQGAKQHSRLKAGPIQPSNTNTKTDDNVQTSKDPAKPKGNNDFRDMFLAGK